MLDPETGVSLASHTTFQIGGPAEWFVEVTREAELEAAVLWAEERELPITILGGGSNMLVSDTGVPGLTLKLMIDTVEQVGDEFIVGAGKNFDELVAETVAAGYWGLENLSHIPGSVGATPVQNVGAYGVEVKDVISNVRVYDRATKNWQTLDAAACQFGYRDSLFKHEAGKDLIVSKVTFALSQTPKPRLEYRDLASAFAEEEAPSQAAIRNAVIGIRAQKFPDWHQVGTAGSFFKNPIITKAKYEALKATYAELPGYEVEPGKIKVPLAWVLQHVCDLRGRRAGTVGSYEGQALVVVNHGGATAAQVEAFATLVSDTVREKTGIEIEWEVTKVG